MYIARAAWHGRVAELAEALAAADTALRIDPNLVEARFNRALAIERLGLHDSARTAWNDYLRNADEHGWTKEARSRLAALANAEDVARRETPGNVIDGVLSDWANAFAAGRQADADRHLVLAKAAGRELAARADALIEDYVKTVESAGEDATLRIAGAHLEFQNGKRLLDDKQPSASEEHFRRAATLFSGHVPGMQQVAEFRIGTALYEQNRLQEATQQLDAILPLIDGRHPTLRAHALWQRALCASARTQWGETIRFFTESAELFERAADQYHLAVVRNMLAQVHDVIGDPDTAWRLRMLALEELGRVTTVRTQTCLAGVSRRAASLRDWDVALSFLNLEVDIGRRLDDPRTRADALLRRAVAQHFLGSDPSATADLSEAGQVILTMKDDAYRTRARADQLGVEALLAGNPADSVRKLTHAIDFHRDHGRRMHLPALYLLRGRALLASGDRLRAARDFDAGIAGLEASRETLPDVAARLGVFDAAEELFAEAVTVALDSADAAAAFRYAERSRARVLLDQLPPVDAQPLAAGMAVVEYVHARERIVAFILSRDALDAISLPRRDLPVDEFNAALRRGDMPSADRAGDVIYAALIAPIEKRLNGFARLVFVPDLRMGPVQFGALRDSGGRRLLHKYAISVSPSAQTFDRIAARGDGRPPYRAVVVAARGQGSSRLAHVQREGRDVSKQYEATTALTDLDANEFAQAMSNADVIHFAGHATAGGDDGSASLMLNDKETLERSAIEALSLRRGPVVVLAACSTARGETRWTEGSLSVARSFLIAGASSVIATLWPIDDADAARFFPQLHARLAAGVAPAEALRATQLEAIQKSDSAGLWASVQVIGR